ncbi:hypothetical protein [Lapillicoccus sp.]|uniref:hypothetical protein n=1 Tax=Lapillicoccus sp. TaxID=1909287 RepID=UPI003267F35D
MCRLLDAVRSIRPLWPLAHAAHAHAAMINDVLLLAMATALHDLLSARGAVMDEIVLAMLVSERRQTVSTPLGNHSGVVAITVSTVGEPRRRLGTGRLPTGYPSSHDTTLDTERTRLVVNRRCHSGPHG